MSSTQNISVSLILCVQPSNPCGTELVENRFHHLFLCCPGWSQITFWASKVVAEPYCLTSSTDLIIHVLHFSTPGIPHTSEYSAFILPPSTFLQHNIKFHHLPPVNVNLMIIWIFIPFQTESLKFFWLLFGYLIGPKYFWSSMDEWSKSKVSALKKNYYTFGTKIVNRDQITSQNRFIATWMDWSRFRWEHPTAECKPESWWSMS